MNTAYLLLGAWARRARLGWFLAACSALTLTTSAASAQSRLAGVIGGPHADTMRLDLTGSIQLALKSATPIQVGNDSVRLSGITLLEAYGRFLPNVTTTFGGYAESGNTLLSATSLVPANAEFYGMGYQLAASVNLFNGYSDQEHMKASAALRDAAAGGLERVKQQVAFDVSQAFYQVVLDRRLEAVDSANVGLSKEREAQLAEEVRIGTRAPPDLYRQQAQEAADEATLIDAQNRVETDGEALLSRLRIDPTTPYTIIEPPVDTSAIPADSLHVDDLVDRALHVRPDVGAAALRTQADRNEMTGARGTYLPSVNLGFNAAALSRVFGREDINGVDELNVSQSPLLDQLGNQWTTQVSLGVSWSLFDNYKTRLDVERATVALDRDQLLTEDLRLRVSTEVQQAVGDYHAAEAKLRASAAGLNAAQQAYEAVQGRYDVGFLASIVDVLTAQTALTQARALREQAVTNMALQKAVLRYAVGDAPIS